MRIHRFLRVVVQAAMFSCLLTMGFHARAADEVSRAVPESYKDLIAPLMTPFEKVKGMKNVFADKDEPGVVLLNEWVTRVNVDGTYTRAERMVYQPMSQRGADQASTDRFRFSSMQERIHLVEARTIRPDGEVKKLGPNAAFIQKGRQRTSSIYDDSQELVVIFPDVKPGVICEVIVVYERFEPSVAGGHGQTCGWVSGWPILNKRMVVDIPGVWKDRMKVHSIGHEIEPVKLNSPADRLVREWSKRNIDNDRHEPAMAPIAQVGPITWLTTFSTWDEVALWYQGLLKGQEVLGPELAGLVDQWTKGVTETEKILEVLHGKVANDVRYEGLEFGMSGLKPYACQTVWKNQYGDCKDKSNLLVSMLRHKGIRARLALVNTDHAGLVDRRIPDFRHFDHAIAAVDKGDGRWIFCDPTIEHGKPGVLAPSSGGRDVLIIDEGRARWMKTPDVTAGSRHYQFDLKLAADGRLTGWLEVNAEGLYAINDVSRFSELDRQSALAGFADLAGEFMPGAMVVDYVLADKAPDDGRSSFKAFVTAPPRQPDDKGRMNLVFPASSGMFYDYGNREERRTSYFQWRDKVSVEARIQLPDGWSPEALPPSIELGGDAYKVKASWDFDDGVCIAKLQADCLESLIPASKVAVYAQANRALSAWLDSPMQVRPGKAASGAANAGKVELPLMPTGEGQLNLVDQLYPATGNQAERRQALEQVIQFFPNDPVTAFDARTRIGLLLYDADDNAEAEKYFREMLSRDHGVKDQESIAWARYLHALCLQDVDRSGEAIALMREIAANENISGYRRGWSACMAALWLDEGEGADDEVAALLEQALLTEADCKQDALPLLITKWLKKDQGGRVAELLSKPVVTQGLEDGGVALLTYTAKELNAKQLSSLLEQLEKLAESDRSPETLKASMAASVEGVRRAKDQFESRDKVRERVKAAFSELAREYLEGGAKVDDGEAIVDALKAVKGTEHRKWLRLAASYYRDFESFQEFGWVSWYTLDHARLQHANDEEGQKFVHALAEACRLLPKSDIYYWECRFVTARVHENLEQWQQAESIYREMIEDVEFDKDFDHAAWHRLANVLELQGRFVEAIKCYSHFADRRAKHLSVTESLLRAGLLHARLGQYAEALDTWRLLADVPGEIHAESPLGVPIREAVLLAGTPEQTIAQWKRTDEWWKRQFLGYMKAIGCVDVEGKRVYLPDSAGDIDIRCGSAVAAKDILPVAADLHSVAMSARWLPSSHAALWAMFSTYAAPMRPRSTNDIYRVMSALGESTELGLASSLEFSSRIHAAAAMNLGDDAKALAIMANELGREEGLSDEHRERCVLIYINASLSSDEKIDEAIEMSSARLAEGLHYTSPTLWFSNHADLLIKAERLDEAVEFLEAKLEDPKFGGGQEAIKIREKLNVLLNVNKRSKAVTEAARRLLLASKPVWYDEVGPETLEDPRIGDLANLDVEKLDHFHDLEAFRVRMMAAQSDLLSMPVREAALEGAVIFLATECQERWDEAAKVVGMIVDDEDLDEILRRRLLWSLVSELMAAGQVEITEEMLENPLMKQPEAKVLLGLGKDLLVAAKAIKEGPQQIRDAIDELIKREISNGEMSVIQLYHSILLGCGDEAGAEQLRNHLKNCRMAPEAIGNRRGLRLQLMQDARRAKNVLKIVTELEKLGGDYIEQAADEVSMDWYRRIDLQALDDLSSEERRALLSTMITKKMRYDRTSLEIWFRHSDFWLGEDEEFSKQGHLKALALINSTNGIPFADMCLLTLLARDEVLKNKDWKAIDKCLDDNQPQHEDPAKKAAVELWQGMRDFRPGQAIDYGELVAACHKVGFLGDYIINDVLACAMINGDRKAVETVVDSMDVDVLADTSGLTVYMDALSLLGRQEERELMMETVPRVLDEWIMDTWQSGDFSQIDDIFSLARRCQLEGRLSEAWSKFLRDQCVDEADTIMIETLIAEMKGDWKAMLAGLERLKPGDISDAERHLLYGVAHMGLGQKDKARNDLEKVAEAQLMEFSFLLKAHNLLRELESGK